MHKGAQQKIKETKNPGTLKGNSKAVSVNSYLNVIIGQR